MLEYLMMTEGRLDFASSRGSKWYYIYLLLGFFWNQKCSYLDKDHSSQSLVLLRPFSGAQALPNVFTAHLNYRYSCNVFLGSFFLIIYFANSSTAARIVQWCWCHDVTVLSHWCRCFNSRWHHGSTRFWNRPPVAIRGTSGIYPHLLLNF